MSDGQAPPGNERRDIEDFGYGLFADDVKGASFAEGRIGYREWPRKNGKLGDIQCLDDRLVHDMDELMA